MRIDELKDETIKTLAQTLKASGLAASESEAIRMATNMSKTNNKVNSNFEERRERNTMGLSFLHKEAKERQEKQEIVKEEAYAQDPAPQSTHTEESCESCGCCESEIINEEKPLNDLFEAETKDEFIAQDLIEKEEDTQPERTQEIPTENKPKRDLSEFKESKVDLGDVFKFKG